MFVPVVPVVVPPRKCPVCGRELGDSKLKNCPSCGHAVPPAQQEKPVVAVVIGLLVLALGGLLFFYRAQTGEAPIAQMIPMIGGLVVFLGIIALLFARKK